MHVSMTTTRGTAQDMVAVATMAGETMVEWLRDLEGFAGLLMLSNEDTGTTHVISFWESKEVAERSRIAPLKLRYALARIIWTIPVVFVAVTLTFFLVRSIDGDPFRHGPLVGLTGPGGWQKYGDYQPESIRDNMRRRYGLDLPWYEQYGNYLGGIATFNLGPSLSYRNRTVEEIITTQGPITLELSLLALGFGFAFGIPIGLWSALARGTPLARLEGFTSSIALSLPAFLVGTLLIYVFAVRHDLVPTTGWQGRRAKILPTITLGIVPLAYCARLTRGAVLETLRNDYVRTARAKGLRSRRVIAQHVLRNSLVPVLSAVG